MDFAIKQSENFLKKRKAAQLKHNLKISLKRIA